MKNADKPAFPTVIPTKTGRYDTVNVHYKGVTKREYFAAMAMQGMMSNSETVETLDKETFPETVAVGAFEIADAMIKAG